MGPNGTDKSPKQLRSQIWRWLIWIKCPDVSTSSDNNICITILHMTHKYPTNPRLQMINLRFVFKRWKITKNKKVLLRERKRHTARCRVVSTHSVVLSWLTPPAGLLTWPPPGYWPDPPPATDLTPPWLLTWPTPPGYWPDPPPLAGQTWPTPQLDRPDPPPPAGQTWTPPPPHRLTDPPPPQLDRPDPPPPPADWPPPPWTDKHLWKQYLPVVLRTRAVTMMHGHLPFARLTANGVNGETGYVGR